MPDINAEGTEVGYGDCFACGDELNEDFFTGPDGARYCQSCYDDEFFTCERCDNIVSKDDICEIQECKYWCSDCVSEHAVPCASCHENVEIGRAVSLADNGYICRNCYENGDYSSCASCGDVHHIDHLHTASDGECYCRSCHDDNDSNNPDDSGSILHCHDFKPCPIFRKSDKEVKPTRYYGIELEVECNDHDVPEDIEDDYQYLKYDGSLNRGFEVVSHPSTWLWIKDHAVRWNDILNLRNKGYRSYEPGTCGMHVHISRTAFTTWMLYKWLHFFSSNSAFILFFSSRGSMGTSWCKIDDKGEVMYKAKTQHGTNRYEAINLNNRNTVEIRIFRGTLNPRKFWANLEFLEALFAWLDPFRPKDIADMTVDSFLTYVHLHEAEYPNLFSWLSDKVPVNQVWTLTSKQEKQNTEEETTCVS